MVFVRVFANILCCAMSCWLAGEIILIAIMDSANIIMNYLIIKVTFTETLQRPNHRYLQIPWLLISECPVRVRVPNSGGHKPHGLATATRSDAIESNEGALSAHNLPPLSTAAMCNVWALNILNINHTGFQPRELGSCVNNTFIWTMPNMELLIS